MAQGGRSKNPFDATDRHKREGNRRVDTGGHALNNSESGCRGRSPLVGDRQRQPHVLRKVRTVERAGPGNDPQPGKPINRLPRVTALGCPEIESRFAAIDLKPGGFERRLVKYSPHTVPLLLVLYV